MSATRVWSFDTEAEAKAFEEGVSLVNDDAIWVDEIKPCEADPSKWDVILIDEDADEDAAYTRVDDPRNRP